MVFATAQECLASLQGSAMSRDFAVLTRGSDKKIAKVLCIQHGEETKNWRRLEQHVERDPSDDKKVISKRQRKDSSKNALGWTWEMYWSVRSLRK